MLDIHFSALLNEVHLSATWPEARVLAEMTLPEARAMLASLAAAIASAEAHRPADTLADLLG